MKRFFALMIATVTAFSAPLFADQPSDDKPDVISGKVIVTSTLNDHFVMKWQTSLSDAVQSPMASADIAPKAQKFQAGEVEWFKEKSANATNDQVYTIDIQIFSKDGKTLLNKQTFTKTISMDDLTSDTPKDNLSVVIDQGYEVQISLS